MCRRLLQQVCLRQLALVCQAVSPLQHQRQHQPQQVSVLQQQQFTRHIQVQAQVFLQRPH